MITSMKLWNTLLLLGKIFSSLLLTLVLSTFVSFLSIRMEFCCNISEF